MANEDLTQDPNYTTPGGAPLAALARNPHQNVDVVHGATGGGGSTNPPESLIVLELVDYVAESQTGGTVQNLISGGSLSVWKERTLTGNNPFSEIFPDAIFWNSDANSSGEIYASLSVEAGVEYTFLLFTSTGNVQPLNMQIYFGTQSTSYIASNHDGYKFTATATETIEVGMRVLPNSGYDGLNDVHVSGLVGATTVAATCTNFVRKIVDGVVTDYAEDGVTPYIVSGTILANCPDASGCDCGGELTDVKQELVDIKALVQQLLNGQTPPPTQTQVDTGQPSLRLAAGTYTKAQVLAQLNIEHYNAFVDTNAGLWANYGLNSIVFVPSLNFNLSVAGSTTQLYDYPVSMEAGGNEYLLQEVDDFVVVVPAGETLDVHMVVWMTGILV